MTQLAPYPADFRIGDDPAKGVYLGDTKIWWQVRPGRADFFSDGGLAASAIQTGKAEPWLSGDSALSATAKPRYVRTASFSGGSALAAISAPKRAISVGFSGAAALGGPARPWNPIDIPGLAYWIDPTQDLTGTSVYGQPERVFSDAAPQVIQPGNYTVGLRFTPALSGRVTHIRGYVEGGTHTFSLWDSGGNKLANVVNVSTGPPTMREVALPTPVNVTAGSTYTASFTMDGLYYGYTYPMPTSAGVLVGLRGYYAGPDQFPSVDAGGYQYHADLVFERAPQPPMADGQVITAYVSHDPLGQAFMAYPQTPLGPKFRTNSINGKPRIEFVSANSDGLVATYNPGTTGLTFVWVAQSAVADTYGMMLVYASSNGSSYELRNEAGSLGTQVIGDYQHGGPAVGAAFNREYNTDYAMLMKMDPAGPRLKLFINDSIKIDVNAASAMPNVATDLRVGHRNDGYHWSGLLAEAMVISGPISDSDRAKLMGYLRAKHGALPAT